MDTGYDVTSGEAVEARCWLGSRDGAGRRAQTVPSRNSGALFSMRDDAKAAEAHSRTCLDTRSRISARLGRSPSTAPCDSFHGAQATLKLEDVVRTWPVCGRCLQVEPPADHAPVSITGLTAGLGFALLATN